MHMKSDKHHSRDIAKLRKRLVTELTVIEKKLDEKNANPLRRSRSIEDVPLVTPVPTRPRSGSGTLTGGAKAPPVPTLINWRNGGNSRDGAEHTQSPRNIMLLMAAIAKDLEHDDDLQDTLLHSTARAIMLKGMTVVNSD